MNIYTFTGNLGGDAEVRATAGGTTVASWSVAVSSGFGDKKTTNWIRCNLWGKRAESGLIPYLVKGQQVAVSGELSVREWEKDGVKNKSVEVNVSEIDLIGGKSEAPRQRDGIASAPQQAPAVDFDKFDDDIPF